MIVRLLLLTARLHPSNDSLDIGLDNMNAGLILPARGDNKVGKFFGRLNELVMHGLQHLLITIQYHLDSTASLHHISTNITYKSYVGQYQQRF